MIGISLFLLSLELLNNIRSCSSQENPEVQTSLGKIMGSTMKSRLGKNIYAFRGIRYAKPPTGEKRFKAAEPIDSWNDIYDATEEGPACISLNGRNMSEDCLVLNIYSNELRSPVDKNPVLKSVIVFIHHGSYYNFSGQSSILGPQYLLDQDIVLVTLNYRLGSLGFMSTGDDNAPGNQGLKDQVLALHFVRNHIEAFGGDPNSVTLAGLEAGSRSAYLHTMSPMSQGLFHKVIAMSGSPATLENLPTHQKHLAIKQAEILNCPTNDMAKMFTCMRSKPAEDFANSILKFQEWHADPMIIWYPVVEPDIPGEERFLTGEPIDLIKTGQFTQVPIMTGCVRDEMGALNMEIIETAKNSNNSILKDLNDNWNKIAPISFIYERDTDRSRYVSKELLKFYFNNQAITLDNAMNRAYIYADAISIYPTRRLALLISGISNQPVYFYMFTYEGRYSNFMWNDGRAFGVSYQDDLLYLFYSAKNVIFTKDDPESLLIDKMISMWATFAKTGEPTSKGNNHIIGITWEKFTPENLAYIEINNTFSMKQNFYADRMKLWESLYPS